MLDLILDRPLALMGALILVWALINAFYLYFATKKTQKDTSALLNRYVTYKLYKRYGSREYEEMTRDLNNRYL